MSVGRRGLRHAGGTDITKCCGREAIRPLEPDNDHTMYTEQGTAIDTDEFPDADLVCPDCERTWPGEGCQHNEFTVVTPTPYEVEDDQSAIWVRATCDDCGERLNALLEIGDVREVES